MAKRKTIHLEAPPCVLRNVHRVPVYQWRRWSSGSRAVFNAVYSSVEKNQRLVLPFVMAPDIRPGMWKTLAWNAAWLSAKAVDWKEKGE